LKLHAIFQSGCLWERAKSPQNARKVRKTVFGVKKSSLYPKYLPLTRPPATPKNPAYEKILRKNRKYGFLYFHAIQTSKILSGNFSGA